MHTKRGAVKILALQPLPTAFYRIIATLTMLSNRQLIDDPYSSMTAANLSVMVCWIASYCHLLVV